MTVVRDGKQETLNVRIDHLDDQLALGEGRASSSDLGITVKEHTPELAKQLGFAEEVTKVEPGSLAERVGTKPKDVIVAIAGWREPSTGRRATPTVHTGLAGDRCIRLESPQRVVSQAIGAAHTRHIMLNCAKGTAMRNTLLLAALA
jgi:hypothetical protein